MDIFRFRKTSTPNSIWTGQGTFEINRNNTCDNMQIKEYRICMPITVEEVGPDHRTIQI